MKKLEKEVEEWLDKRYLKDMGVRKPCREAYLAAAEPREKRIEQLEKENVKLREKLEDIERARDYWKSSSFDWRHKCTSRKPFKAAVKAQKQLAEAKELIEDMYDQIPSSHSEYYKDVMERARQFFKELEE